MYSAKVLLNFHTQALFTHDTNGRLLTTNEPDPQPAPCFFLGRTQDSILYRFRHDLPQSLVEQLKAVAQTEPLGNPVTPEPKYTEEYISLLETHAPIQLVWSGPAYTVPVLETGQSRVAKITKANAKLLQGDFEWLRDSIEEEQPCLAVVQDGKVVSMCRSVRIGQQAHEAGVETLPEYRGRGYATAVVAAWAKEVAAAGIIPLYSTSWQNKASQAVARKLAMHQYGVTFHIT